MQGCFSPETRPAWVGNSDELSIFGNQPYREIVSPQQDFVFIPDKYDSDQNRLKTTNKVPLDTSRLSKDTKNYLYNLEELLRLRPELIEASTKVDEQIANIVGARSQFSPTTNLGLVNDQVLLSNSESRRKTSGGYVDGYIDFDYKISDFGGRNANYRAALIEKELAENEFRQTINSLSKRFSDIYFEYSLLSFKNKFLEEFELDLKELAQQAQERFLGGVSTIFEINTVEQALLRLELKKSVFNQDLERVRSEFLSYFPFDLESGSNIKFDDLAKLISENLDDADSMFERNTHYLEEKINELRAAVAQEDYFRAISAVSPETNAKLRAKSFDLDEYAGDYEVVLTLQGSLGVYDGGASNSRALSALKRKESAVFRRDAARSNNNSRLTTIKGQVKSIVNRIMDIEKLLQDYEEDLSIAEERSVNINFAPGEIIAAKERILEQNLSEIDNRISLSKLMSELLYLHGLYPYILSIEELGKGN